MLGLGGVLGLLYSGVYHLTLMSCLVQTKGIRFHLNFGTNNTKFEV